MKYLSVLFLLTSNLNSFSQPIPGNGQAKQNLSIGDTLPTITMNKLYNSSEQKENVHSFLNKLLIIDFWATWCVPCVSELPRLDSIQRDYGGQVTILPVTDEKYRVVKNLIQSNPRLKQLQLPFVTEDTQLNKLFKHTIVPHEVWVNNSGIVMAVTSQLEITNSNITSFLKNGRLNLPLKKDQLDFKVGQPVINLYWQDKSVLADSTILDYSVVTKYRPGLPASSHLWVTNLTEAHRSPTNTFTINGITITDCRLITLFTLAFDLTFTRLPIGFLNPHRIILDVFDSLRYMEHTDTSHQYTESFMRQNELVYEMKTNKALPDTIFGRKMIEDLNQYFPLKGRIVKREDTCWIIVRKDARADSLKSREKKSELYQTANTLGIKNKTLNVLLAQLNAFYNIEPVRNESGITCPVDIELQFHQDYNEYPDIKAIKKSFNNYGLDMVRQTRVVDKLYLTDKPENYGKF